jgi:hypothetical protein
MPQMPRLKRISVIAAALLILPFSLAELCHLLRFGHFFPFGMHADVVVRKADYGIEGITKTYEAKLTNYGFVPISITVFNFIDDAFTNGTEVGYTVEKWDPLEKKWGNIFNDADKSSWCHPYPLGIVQGRIVTKRLWPGQSVFGSEEATAASDGFAVGDRARFLICARNGLIFPTPSFPIDEHRTNSDVPSRVRN